MTKRMLVDASHPEETRVAIVDGNWLSDFDFERASKKQLKGNIYLAKVIRIEPSLQAAFVEYGGNRHGFLPFTEIHPDYFRIPVADRPHDEESHEDDGLDTAQDDSSLENVAALGEYQEEVQAQESTQNEENSLEEIKSLPGLIPSELTPIVPEILSNPLLAQPLVDHSTPGPVNEFSASVSQDLGLITDFGNAVVTTAAVVEAIPVETVGGEVGEEERYRRPPRPRYKIQEVVKRRQVMLIQVVKEERGNKGAALTTFLSLAGRYCVLMPNTDHGGGVSRKITNHQDRRRMKEILDQLEIPEGMAVILRTAGMEQDPPEIQRDLEYLLRLWNNIREQTLQSTAPALIYEEANLIKRSMRDLFSKDVEEILVSGSRSYQLAVDFLRTIMPDQLEKVKLYEESVPLFFRYNVEKQIDQLYSTTVQLRSGGYIVINPTEALVSIDVNSGRATRERHIESTALKTNLEAADEVARQLRLRDLAGLVVIDFIDMEDGRNNAAVERRVKEAMRADRARLQIGRISPFGLLELSRQRLHPSLMEINFEKCAHCAGVGLVRSVDSSAISILRMIEEEGIKQGSGELVVHLPTQVALYILNQKRSALSEIERRYNLQALLHSDETLVPPNCRIERNRVGGEADRAPLVNADRILAESEPSTRDSTSPTTSENESAVPSENRGGRDTNYRSRRGPYADQNRPRQQDATNDDQRFPPSRAPVRAEETASSVDEDNVGNVSDNSTEGAEGDDANKNARRGRRRGRRGGRNRRSGPPNKGPREEGMRDGAPHEGGAREQTPRETTPREGQNNYRPREDRPREDRPREDRPREEKVRDNRDWKSNSNPRTPSAPYPSTHSEAVVSVHDIDTTPRVAPSAPRESATPKRESFQTFSQPIQSSSGSSSPPPYEIVDKPTDKPKGGWWRRLTGQ